MKQRILTGVTAGSAFILLLVLGGYWFAGLILLLAVIGYDEFVRMINVKQYPFTRLAGLIGLLGLTIPWENGTIVSNLSPVAFVWLLMLVLMAVTVVSKNKVTIDQIALTFIGVFYLGLGFHAIIETRLLEPGGLYWTLLIILCIWATDSGAYFTGMAFGKHLLWPAISPKKTVEGAAGGLLLSVAVAIGFALYRPDALALPQAVLIGIAIAVIGQLGDLIQSAYKRVKGIKDTGNILPGHGGVLDRVDSWLIVFPFLHLLWMVPQ